MDRKEGRGDFLTHLEIGVTVTSTLIDIIVTDLYCSVCELYSTITWQQDALLPQRSPDSQHVDGESQQLLGARLGQHGRELARRLGKLLFSSLAKTLLAHINGSSHSSSLLTCQHINMLMVGLLFS